jgi:hypothetical protein
MPRLSFRVIPSIVPRPEAHTYCQATSHYRLIPIVFIEISERSRLALTAAVR